MTYSATLDISLDWMRSPGVSSPELASTWCSLEVRINDRPVTLVEDTRGAGLRKGVHTSAYPLARWIAEHWLALQHHVRPSATSISSWTWSEVSREPWLRMHNFRGAGDGMPWPDLTLVPEGEATRATWAPGPGLAGQPVLFLTGGDFYLSTLQVRTALGSFVQQVLDRLRELGITNTFLEREWGALGELDDDERDFAVAASRLGLDPFNVDPSVATSLERAAALYDQPFLEEFLDSADPRHLPTATSWVDRAEAAVRRLKLRADYPIISVDAHVEHPWERGYVAARAFRSRLGLDATERIDLSNLVGLARVAGEPAGIQGLIVAETDLVGLGVPTSTPASKTLIRFAQARALGLSVLTSRSTALLDPAHTDLAKQTRAFAAELLAPAEGIRAYLAVFPTVGERAIDAVAARFDASPWLVQHQYSNQLV